LIRKFLVWSDGEPNRLSSAAAKAVQDPANDVWFSSASVWELAIKCTLGKLTLHRPSSELVKAQQQYRILELPVRSEHAVLTETLPSIHKDPFDRILIAQAIAEGLTLVTVDRLLQRYPVTVLW